MRKPKSALVRISVPLSPIFRGPLSVVIDTLGLGFWWEDTASEACLFFPVSNKPTDNVKGNVRRLEMTLQECLSKHARVTYEDSTCDPNGMPIGLVALRLDNVSSWAKDLDRLYEDSLKSKLNSQEQYLMNMGIAA